jgi:hypothetical protein
MYEKIKPLVDRADANLQSVRGKRWNELTPEDVGHLCGDLDGIIMFVRGLESNGVFALDERMRTLEAKQAVIDAIKSQTQG